jgi:hypothetical protein
VKNEETKHLPAPWLNYMLAKCLFLFSKKESHQRHHIFDENYANVIRRKHSYGVNYFKPKVRYMSCCSYLLYFTYLFICIFV